MGKVTAFPKDTGVNPWFETAVNRNATYTDISELKDSYDFIIVGAGFGGVMAAFELAENAPDSKIAVFDALKVGTFSSGRNAGFLWISQVTAPLVGFDHYTIDDQLKLCKLNEKVITRIDNIIKEKAPDTDFRWDGLYHAVREERNVKALDDLAKMYDKMGHKYEIFDHQEMTKRLGTDFYTKGLYSTDCVLDNPAELIRALALALPKNVSLFENTVITDVKDGAHPAITLKDGRKIEAAKIILTVNAFIKHFGFGGQEIKDVCAIQSFGAMTRELTDDEMKIFEGVQPWGVVATHPAGATVRYTPKRRVFVRTDIAYAPGYRLNIPQQRFEQSKPLLRNAFVKRFPTLKDVPFEYTYGGLIPFTANAEPLFGEIAENIFAGTTSEGAGVNRASILGTFLADLILGKKSEDLDYILANYHPSYLPPEVLRVPGANAALWWKNVKAGTEL
jgi:glycine/D-amino acid oxidase-like deaminating enzyme